MVRYSVLMPQRDSWHAARQLLPALRQVLENLLLPFEIICIDDASESAGELDELLDEYRQLRIVRFDRSRGISAALCAGLAAARGEVVIAIDANTRFSMRYVPHLIARLSQNDLVIAEPERSLGAAVFAPISKFARLLWGSARLHASEDLFWAARREAVAGLALPRGAFRALPELVVKRGFRICRLTLAEGLPPQGAEFRPGVFERLAARWLDRRFEPHLGREVVRGDAGRRQLKLARVDGSHARTLPSANVAPVKKEGGSA
jgi:glycosyltransferase involved in cell wall biosynthesis